MGSSPIPFFLDNCVPDSVGTMLTAAGHDVVRLRETMPVDSKDPIVAIACAASGRVLISHDMDFKQIAKRLQLTQNKYRQLHRIGMRCSEVNSASRLKTVLHRIEYEWELVLRGESELLVVEVTEVAIRIAG